MQCKDIPDRPVLEFLATVGPCGATWFDDSPRPDNSVLHAMPPLPSDKLARAKIGQLIRRGLVDGCACGCRGDFYLSDKGRQFLEQE